MDIPIIEKDGKKVFVGKEDDSNPPILVKNPLMRYCGKCHAESTNDKTECAVCFTPFDDGKMECPVCLKFFDYLLGDTKRGCEGCYDRTKDQPERGENGPTGPIFD